MTTLAAWHTSVAAVSHELPCADMGKGEAEIAMAAARLFRLLQNTRMQRALQPWIFLRFDAHAGPLRATEWAQQPAGTIGDFKAEAHD